MSEILKFVQPESKSESALDIYWQYFPDFVPSPFQQDLIEQLVTDFQIWHEALTFWAGNDYRARSVKNIIDYYEQLLGKRPPKFQAGIASSVSPNMNCDKCGNERRIRGNLESWPCDKCRPQELMAWERQRGKR